MRSGGSSPHISGFILFYKEAHALNIERLEEFIDRSVFREAVTSHNLHEPLARWATSLLVEADRLGVVVVDLARAHGHDRAAARLVLVVVVKAHLAEGGHGAHLYFKSSVALRRVTEKC